jgi:hypothetical protein
MWIEKRLDKDINIFFDKKQEARKAACFIISKNGLIKVEKS